MLCYTVLYCILCAKRLLAAAGWHSSTADLGSRFYTECKIKSTHDKSLSKCLGLLLIRISVSLHQMSLLRPLTAIVQYEFCSPTLILVSYGGIKATLYKVLHHFSLLTTHHIDVAILGRCKSCHGHCSLILAPEMSLRGERAMKRSQTSSWNACSSPVLI